MQVLLALSSQWEEEERRQEMAQSGRQVINILHNKLGAGSLSPATDLPGPGIFRKLHVKLSNSYDKGIHNIKIHIFLKVAADKAKKSL